MFEFIDRVRAGFDRPEPERILSGDFHESGDPSQFMNDARIRGVIRH